MAVLKAIEERFYQIPDDVLAKYLIPADQVDEVLKKAGVCMAPPPQQQPMAGPGGQPMPGPGGQPMGGPCRQPMPQGQVQAYSHHGGHEEHGHEEHGHEWHRPWFYSDYYNYSNYSNYGNWGW